MIYTYNEYLKKIKNEDKVSWLVILKASLEIFDGEFKGLANVSDVKHIREA